MPCFTEIRLSLLIIILILFMKERAKEIETDEETLLLIMKALKQPLGYDLRSGNDELSKFIST